VTIEFFPAFIDWICSEWTQSCFYILTVTDRSLDGVSHTSIFYRWMLKADES